MCGFPENRILIFQHQNSGTKWPKMKYLSHTIPSSILSFHGAKIRFLYYNGSLLVFSTKEETDVSYLKKLTKGQQLQIGHFFFNPTQN